MEIAGRDQVRAYILEIVGMSLIFKNFCEAR